jgi:hypothetical protein
VRGCDDATAYRLISASERSARNAAVRSGCRIFTATLRSCLVSSPDRRWPFLLADLALDQAAIDELGGAPHRRATESLAGRRFEERISAVVSSSRLAPTRATAHPAGAGEEAPCSGVRSQPRRSAAPASSSAPPGWSRHASAG